MRRVALVRLLSGLLIVSLAREGTAETPREHAEALFREGRSAALAGDYRQACTRFGESQKLDPSTGTLLNLGDCAEHLGQLLAARNYFQEAIGQLGKNDPRLMPASERLQALEGRLPRLTITLAPDSPPGTTIERDGRAIPDVELGVAVPVDPGEHALSVLAPGRSTGRRTVVLREGQAESLVLRPPTTDVAKASQEGVGAPAPEPSSNPARLGWIAGGIGVAGFAVAGISGVVLINQKSTADQGCPNKMNCSTDALSAISANTGWLVANTIGWIVGVVGVSFGTYWILTHRQKPTRSLGAGLLSSPTLPNGSAQVEF